MITDRNDGQNCKNKTEIDSNKLDSSFNVCSKSIPALILPDDLTVPSTLTVTLDVLYCYSKHHVAMARSQLHFTGACRHSTAGS